MIMRALRHTTSAPQAILDDRMSDVPQRVPAAILSDVEIKTSRSIAYVMSRFPKISETFILYEILELERLGCQVEVFPLLREQEDVVHPEAEAVVGRTRYSRLVSRDVLAAQWYWLSRRPGAYISTWARVVAGNIRSRRFLLRALAVVPQAALFARQMKQLKIEHVHAHYATHPALAAYVVRRLADIPYSFTAHAHDIYVDRTMLGEKIRDASFVVTISEYNRTLLAELYAESREKTVVIHCGVDPAVFRPAERARPVRRRTGPFTLVCVASLQQYKGHPFLIEACALLRDRGIPFRCFLIGEGEDRPAIEEQISRLGLQRQIQLLGRQPRNRVSRFVREADAMVLPSIVTSTNKQEGIPVALMEALAAERPVVATAISGIPELIEDGVTGLLAPERDAAALADALERLYTDCELGTKLGAAGREKVMRDFHLSTNTGRLHGLLNQDWSDESASTMRSQLLSQEFGNG